MHYPTVLDDNELESELADDALVTLVVDSEDAEDVLLLLSVELLSVDALLAVDTLDTDSLDEDALLAVLADELLRLEDDAVLADVPLVLRLDSLLADWLEDDAVLAVLSVLSVDALLAVELLAVLDDLELEDDDDMEDEPLDSSSTLRIRASPPPDNGKSSVENRNENGARFAPPRTSIKRNSNCRCSGNVTSSVSVVAASDRDANTSCGNTSTAVMRTCRESRSDDPGPK